MNTKGTGHQNSIVSFYNKLGGIIFIAILIFISKPSFAQDFNYNQNLQVKNELEDGKKYQFNDGEYYILEIQELPEKDVVGNSGYHLIFKGEKDTLIFGPENPFFPLTYVQIAKNWQGRHHFIKDEGQNEGQYVIFKKNLLQVKVNLIEPIETASYTGQTPRNLVVFAVPHAAGYSDAIISKGMYLNKKDVFKLIIEFNAAMGNEIIQTNSGYHCHDYPGLTEFYKFRNKFIDSLLIDAKRGYMALLSEALKNEELFVYNKAGSYNISEYGQDSKIRVKTEKSDDNISKLVFQFPFTDGEFYDKEKFFQTSTLQSDSKRFNYKSDNNVTLVPFAGRVLVVSFYRDYYGVAAVISPIANDSYALCLKKQQLTSVSQSETMWCKQELEENYDIKKDKYVWENFFNTYVTNLMTVK